MKRIPKTGVALLQQTKALNADTITLLHHLVSDARLFAREVSYNNLIAREYYRDALLLTRVIKRIAVGQKSTKAAIKGQRTTERKSKKHPRPLAMSFEASNLVVA